MDKENKSLDPILNRPSSKHLSLRLGPVKLHWFPSSGTCLMRTSSEKYSFKRNGSVVVITDPQDYMVNIRLKRNGFSFLDMTEKATLDDESGTDSSDLDEGEKKEADEVKEKVEQATEKDVQEETTEKAEEEVEEATNKETESEEEAMQWAEGNIKEWNTEFLLWDQ